MAAEKSSYGALHNYTKVLSVAMGYRDISTQLHSERVVFLSEELGACCGLSDENLGILKIAALFHDIGKIGIPDPVLLKSNAYNDDDWQVMKKHPDIGAEIIGAIDLDGATEAANVIRSHHEHYDGSGYPYGISGQNISLLSRIISITDSYDAMAMTRPYHQGRSHQEIMAILNQETGAKFDPHLMTIFEHSIANSQYKAN